MRITPARQKCLRSWHDSPSFEEPVYRLFRPDKSGHVERAEVIQATDLDEAKTEALQLVDGKTLKLWDRTRRMAIYPRKDET